MTSATLPDDTPLEPDDELLVAYLDGELDRKDQTELENRLVDDAELRQRLQQLQTGWDLLDDLPDPAPSLKLVESTLELVVSDIVKASPPKTSLWSRVRVPTGIAAACLFGIGAAVASVSVIRSRNYERQLQDLAIAESLDAYYYGSDLELMRQLSANPDWSNMVTAAREIGDIKVESIANIAATPIDQREELIRDLPLEKVDQLNSRWERFKRLDEANRTRIRDAAEVVAAQADSEYLLQTMKAYAVWRDRLPTELRDQVESTQGQERRDAIREAIERTQISISKRSSLKLDDESIEWIYFSLRQIVRQRIEAGDEPTRLMLERSRSRTGGDNAEFFTIASIVMGGGSWGRGGPGGGPGGPGGGHSGTGTHSGPGGKNGSGGGPGGPGGGRRPFSRSGEMPDRLQPHELDAIEANLPNRALDIFDLVAGGDPLKEMTTVGIWAEETVRRKFPFKREDTTRLQRYNDLDGAYRDVLDLMPPKEILNELSPSSGRFRGFPPQPR